MKRLFDFFRYKRILKRNKKTLMDSRPMDNPVGIEYDWIYRLYTVFLIPPQDKKEIEYGYRDQRSWGFHVDSKMRDFITEINNTLFINMGISNYVELDRKNTDYIDDNNIRVVFKFRPLNIKRLFILGIIFSFIILISAIISAIVFL